MRDGYFHGRIRDAPPMPAKASAVTFSLDGTTRLVGLAVQEPPREVMGRDGSHMGPLELIELAGFVSLDADPARLRESGKGWTVTCDARTGQTDVRTAEDNLFFSVTIPLLMEDEGAQWLAAAGAQDGLPVIAGPGVTVDLTTGSVALEPDRVRWLFADFKAVESESPGA